MPPKQLIKQRRRLKMKNYTYGMLKEDMFGKELCEIVIRGLPFNPNDPQQVHQLDQLALNAEYESKQTGKRTKETNHSALIYSGKLNSTHLVLGLDQLEEGGVEKVVVAGVEAAGVGTLKVVGAGAVKIL